jgi:hypothetical protein
MIVVFKNTDYCNHAACMVNRLTSPNRRRCLFRHGQFLVVLVFTNVHVPGKKGRSFRYASEQHSRPRRGQWRMTHVPT